MSPSIRPTRCPAWASAAATFAATVDLPTPPLPLDTASARPRCGISTGVGGGGTAPGAGRAVAAARPPPGSTTLMRTALTPATAWAALRASRASEAGSSCVSRNVKLTAPASSTTRSWTIPAATTSLARRGFCTAARAASTRLRRAFGGGTGRNVSAGPGGGQRMGLLDDDRPVHYRAAEHPVAVGEGAAPRDGILHRRVEVVADGNRCCGVPGTAAPAPAADPPHRINRAVAAGSGRDHER